MPAPVFPLRHQYHQPTDPRRRTASVTPQFRAHDSQADATGGLVSCVANSLSEAYRLFDEKPTQNKRVVVVATNWRKSLCPAAPFFCVPDGVHVIVMQAGKIVLDDGGGEPGWKPGFHWSSPFAWDRYYVSHIVSKASMPIGFSMQTCMTVRSSCAVLSVSAHSSDFLPTLSARPMLIHFAEGQRAGGHKFKSAVSGARGSGPQRRPVSGPL